MAKKILGCDIAKDTFDCCLFNPKSQTDITLGTKMPNNKVGFTDLAKKLAKHGGKNDIVLVMEATGVYHENLVDFFYEKGYRVHVALPNQVKGYSKFKGGRAKTDALDARMIAHFGATIGSGPDQTQIPLWTPFDNCMGSLRCFARQYGGIKKMQTQLRGRREAHTSTNRTLTRVNRQDERINKCLTKELEECSEQMKKVATSNTELWRKVQNICQIPGIGELTVLTIVGELNGFEGIKNTRQLVSYVGLDVPPKESGNEKKAGHISHRGNAHVRQALYMPAMCVCRYGDKNLKGFYERIAQRVGVGHRKKAIVALMRKMLCLIFTLWTKDVAYDPNHQWQPTKPKQSSDSEWGERTGDHKAGASKVPAGKGGRPTNTTVEATSVETEKEERSSERPSRDSFGLTSQPSLPKSVTKLQKIPRV